MVGSLQIVLYKVLESDLYHTWALVMGSKRRKKKAVQCICVIGEVQLKRNNTIHRCVGPFWGCQAARVVLLACAWLWNGWGTCIVGLLPWLTQTGRSGRGVCTGYWYLPCHVCGRGVHSRRLCGQVCIPQICTHRWCWGVQSHTWSDMLCFNWTSPIMQISWTALFSFSLLHITEAHVWYKSNTNTLYDTICRLPIMYDTILWLLSVWYQSQSHSYYDT